MDLKEFIENTIIQITDGLNAGHKYVTENKFGTGVDSTHMRRINFDIAVTVNESDKTGVGGKLSVANIVKIGSDKEIINNTSSYSRIQFHIDLDTNQHKNTNPGVFIV
jgi:hypothetical protein